MKKKFITTGLLAGLVAGTGAGLILEQSGFAGASSATVIVGDDTGTSDTGTTDTGTTDTGTTDTGTEVRPDRSARLTEVLQPLVDDGTINADQLTKIVAALDAAGPMGGRGGPGGHGRGGHGPGGRGPGIEVVATALGITTDELHTALEGGQTIAQVAADQGVDVQTVIDAMVAEAQTRIAERVTAGDLTQAEADAKLTELTTRITDMVNNGRPERDAHDGPAVPAADTSTTAAG